MQRYVQAVWLHYNSNRNNSFRCCLHLAARYMSDNESGGNSVSSRGFRDQADYYTAADDKVVCLLHYSFLLSRFKFS